MPEKVVTEQVIQCELMPADGLLVLTSAGRMFQRTRDPKDFAQGPNHRAGYLWTEIKGPLDWLGPA